MRQAKLVPVMYRNPQLSVLIHMKEHSGNLTTQVLSAYDPIQKTSDSVVTLEFAVTPV